MSAVTGNRPARVEMNQPVKSCKFAFSFTQIQWLVLIRLVTDSIIKSPFLFPLSMYLARFSASGRKHSAASRENRLRTPKWGAHPPRVLLDAPRVRPLACATDTEVLEISMRPLFSARARKIAPEGGCAPHQLRSSGLVPRSSVKTSRRAADWSDRAGRAPHFLFQLSSAREMASPISQAAFRFQHFPTGHAGAAKLVRSGYAP
jgi:hypothetical protein